MKLSVVKYFFGAVVVLVSGVAFAESDLAEQAAEFRAANPAFRSLPDAAFANITRFGPKSTAAAQALAAPAKPTEEQLDRWAKCSAISGALYSISEHYVNRDNLSCYSDSDCVIGYVGGFCASVTTRTNKEAYKLWESSTAFNSLMGQKKTTKCVDPVGLCLVAEAARCDIDMNTRRGTCVATRTSESPFALKK